MAHTLTAKREKLLSALHIFVVDVDWAADGRGPPSPEKWPSKEDWDPVLS